MSVKELKEELADDPEFKRMFVDEARLATVLNHPNIVKTFEVSEANEAYFLVMEYLEGQTLDAIVRVGDCPLRLHLTIIAHVLNGLDYTHRCTDEHNRSLQIVHRDLSPRNIFVTYSGHVKIVDFGIAKAVNRSNRSRIGDIKGTVAYMAPEQVRAEGLEDQRADLFTVGVLLWEAAARQPIWQGLSDVAVLHRLAKGAVPKLSAHAPEAPDKLVALVERALNPDPDGRPESASVMLDDLAEVLVEMGGPSPRAEASKWMTTHFAAERQQTHQRLARRNEAREDPPPLPINKASTRAQPTLTEELLGLLGGPYRALRPFQRVADSGFAEVEHTATRARLIVTLKSVASTPDFLERAPIIAGLRHPNTVRLIDFGRHPRHPYFFALYERFGGQTLKQAIEAERSFSTREALRTVRQLLCSLAEAHHLGLTHGRIGPSKVFLVDKSDEWIKVLGYHSTPAETTAATDLAATGQLFSYLTQNPASATGSTPAHDEDDAALKDFLGRLDGTFEPFDNAGAALRALAELELDLAVATGVAPPSPGACRVGGGELHQRRKVVDASADVDAKAVGLGVRRRPGSR